jgi:hypothetical protein
MLVALLAASCCFPGLDSVELFEPPAAQPPKPAALKFLGLNYVKRFSQGSMVEYTPEGQDDLKKWTDMITVNKYSKVTTGEALAKTANAVLDTYKRNQATVVRTNSVPRTSKRPAEHLIVVMFVRSDFVEVAFARFLLEKGTGHSVVYSRRAYGANGRGTIADWLETNGQKTENALMSMSPLPKA